MNAAIFAFADEEEQLDEPLLVKACYPFASAADVTQNAKREPFLSGAPTRVIRNA
jgi:hypothetical protein